MQENRHSGAGSFFNGFILGALVGAGLVFLFGTQKGRRVLQLLLEQVGENTELSELLEMPDDEEEYFDGAEGLEMEDEEPEETVKVERHEESKPHKTVAKVKRFFRGTTKKLVS